MSKVSVIIPAFNASAYVARALESVLDQDYDDIEVVVINDGSTDDTDAVLKGYLDDKRIIYRREENGGVSRALNMGMCLASGSYICFLHADDIFLPSKIRKQAAVMARYPAIGVSYTNENYFLEGGDSCVESPYFHFSGDIFYFLKRNNFIHASTVMLRKEATRGITFDEDLRCHEDWDFFLKLSSRGIVFKYIDEALSAIYLHPKNLSSDASVMDTTRLKTGLRAKELWSAFKKGINLRSSEGICALKRYLMFKAYASIIGFPYRPCFNKPVPREVLKRYEPRPS